jgi:hypothetical protein
VPGAVPGVPPPEPPLRPPQAVSKVASPNKRIAASTCVLMELVRHLSAVRKIASVARNKRKFIVTDGFGYRGNSLRTLPGETKEPFVVVTLTAKGTDEDPLTVTGVVDGLQVACAGAPVHVMLTEPVKPPLGFTCRLYAAGLPAVTVADNEPPLAAPIE